MEQLKKNLLMIPVKTARTDRTYDHTKAKDGEAYEADSHGGKGIGRDNRRGQGDDKGFGEKRRPQQPAGGKPKTQRPEANTAHARKAASRAQNQTKKKRPQPSGLKSAPTAPG